MNFRGLLIAVMVLAGLGGVLYWSQHRKAADETAAPVPATVPFLKVDPADISKLVVRQKEPVTLEKTDGQWRIVAPEAYPADQEAVAGLLSALSGLSADRVVDDKASDRKQYGLAPAAVELEIVSKHAGTRRLLLGDNTPAGGNAYAALASSPKVFTVGGDYKTSLGKGLNDLRDKSLITLHANKVSRVELVRKGQDLTFERRQDGWQILHPSPMAADSSAVEDLVGAVTSARMDLTVAVDARIAFARGTPWATVKLTGDQGEQTLDVRTDKGDYFAKSSVVSGVYKVDSTLAQAVDKKLDDFVTKKKS